MKEKSDSFRGQIGSNISQSRIEVEENILRLLYEWWIQEKRLDKNEICKATGLNRRQLTYYIHSMIEHGYIEEAEEKEYLFLTDFGKEQGHECRERHQNITHFLQLTCGVEEEIAAESACRMEHSLLAPVTLFIVLCRISVKASVVLLICVPLVPLSIVAVQKIAGKLFRKYWGYYSNLGDIFLENLQGLTTLKIYQADEEKAVQMDDAAQKFRKITMKVLTMQLNSTSVMDIVAYGGAAVGMAVAAGEYFAGNITLSGTMMIVLLASEFFIPLRLLGSFFHIAMNGMSASDKIFQFLDTEESEKGNLDFSEREKNTEKNSLSISLNHVDFSYEENRQILHEIALLIPAGSFISLVGESGCGKSTIAGIISGKNRGYKGDISIGNIPLSKIKEEELLSHITRVCHNSYLFKGTVEENLRMAKEDASSEEMIAVLRKVNLWNFLSAENGLKTQILEKGSNLSGGQCQRLGLARALLHDTPIYIFDEATSNIDTESEEMIMDVIKELAGTKTIILISHRLFNVVESDCIYMLENGQIAERGTHEDLMHNKNAYYRLYTAQQELEQYGKEKQTVEQKENNKKNNEENTIDRSSNLENKEGRKKTWKQVV